MNPSSIRARIDLLGVLVVLAHVGMVLPSWLEAAKLWSVEPERRTYKFFDGLSALFPWIPFRTFFTNDTNAALWNLVPLLLATVAAAVLLIQLQRAEPTAFDGTCVQRVRRWAYGLAALSLLAFPVFTQDFWLSPTWGRMIVQGHNIYYVDFTDEAARGLPLDHFPMRMAYGPLWGLFSASLMAVTGGYVLAIAILFKAVLAVAWFGAVWLIERLTLPQGPRAACVALVTIGWLPASVSQSLAEGHNDIAMVALFLLWWFLLRHGKGWPAQLALAASALCKYVSVSLFLVDAIHALRVERLSFARYVIRIAPAGILIVAAFAPFFRSLEFFEGMRLIGSWHFMNLRDSFTVLGALLHLPLAPLAMVAQLVFAVTAAYYLWNSVLVPSPENFNRLFLAIMAFVTFAVSPHLWPWYLIWVLAPATLTPGWWLSRFVVGMSLIAPFTVAFWWVDGLEDNKDVGALVLYGGGMIWAFVSHRLVRPIAVPPPAPQPQGST